MSRSMFPPEEVQGEQSPETGRHKNMTRTVTSGIAWTGTLYFIQTLLQLAFMAVLARLLTPAEFGVAAAANLFIQFVRLFSEVGIAQTIVQLPQITDRLLRVGFTIVFILSLCLFALTEVAAPLVGAWFQQPNLTDVVRVLGVVFLVQAFSVIPQNLLYRRLQAKAVLISLLISMIVGTGVVAVPLAFNGWSYWALIAGTIVQEVIFVIVLSLQIKVPHLPAFTTSEARHLFKTSIGFSLSRIFNFFALFGDNLVVGRYLAADALGLYSRAYNLMNLPTNVYSAVADRVVFPAMSRVQSEPHRLKAAYLHGVSLTASAGIPMTAFLILTAPDFIRVLLGSVWVGVIVPFQILAAAMYPRLAYKINASVLRSMGLVYTFSILQAVQAVTIIGGCYLLRSYGLNAISAVVSVVLSANSLLVVLFACRHTGVTLVEFMRCHVPGLALGLCVTISAYVTVTSCHYLDLSAFVTFGASVIFSAVVAGVGELR